MLTTLERMALLTAVCFIIAALELDAGVPAGKGIPIGFFLGVWMSMPIIKERRSK